MLQFAQLNGVIPIAENALLSDAHNKVENISFVRVMEHVVGASCEAVKPPLVVYKCMRHLRRQDLFMSKIQSLRFFIFQCMEQEVNSSATYIRILQALLPQVQHQNFRTLGIRLRLGGCLQSRLYPVAVELIRWYPHPRARKAILNCNKRSCTDRVDGFLRARVQRYPAKNTSVVVTLLS